MRPHRHTPKHLLTVLLMWLLPLCAVINSGLELLAIPGNAPRVAQRWDRNGESNSVSAEKDIHHIPPAHRHTRHHRMITISASAPPRKLLLPRRIIPAACLPAPPYRAAFPFDTFPEITAPPPEQTC